MGRFPRVRGSRPAAGGAGRVTGFAAASVHTPSPRRGEGRRAHPGPGGAGHRRRRGRRGRSRHRDRRRRYCCGRDARHGGGGRRRRRRDQGVHQHGLRRHLRVRRARHVRRFRHLRIETGGVLDPVVPDRPRRRIGARQAVHLRRAVAVAVARRAVGLEQEHGEGVGVVAHRPHLFALVPDRLLHAFEGAAVEFGLEQVDAVVEGVVPLAGEAWVGVAPVVCGASGDAGGAAGAGDVDGVGEGLEKDALASRSPGGGVVGVGVHGVSPSPVGVPVVERYGNTAGSCQEKSSITEKKYPSSGLNRTHGAAAPVRRQAGIAHRGRWPVAGDQLPVGGSARWIAHLAHRGGAAHRPLTTGYRPLNHRPPAITSAPNGTPCTP